MKPLPYWMSAVTGLAVLLTTLSVRALFTGPSWMADTFTLIIVLTATATVSRMPVMRLPRFVPAAAEAAAAIFTICAVSGGEHAGWGFVPTPAALHDLAARWGSGMNDIAQSQAPTVATDGLVLIMLVWLAVVAIAADVACQDLRVPALAGLPLVTVYAVVSTFHPDGITPAHFIPAAIGFLLVVGAGSAVRGRRLTRRAVWQTAAAGASAVLFAGFVPLPEPGGAPLDIYQRGLGNRTVINPFLDLRRDLVRNSNPTVLTYRTEDKDPPPLRIMVDSQFNGRVWSPGTVDLKADHLSDDGLPNPPGLGSDVRTQYRTLHVTLRTLHQDFLPAPYPAVRTVAGDNWIYDPSTLDIAGRVPTTSGTQYSVTYVKVDPTAEQLITAGQSADARSATLNLPKSLPSIVRKTAHRVAGTRTNKYEIASALQQYLRSDQFRYTLKAPSDGGNDALAAFLTKKSGYCVQFASAMAVMARVMGIPARVAIGFLPGTQHKDGTWTVTLADAHAWPELYFNGVGWIRFEPTPAARTGTAPDWTTAAAPVTTLGGQSTIDVPDSQSNGRPVPRSTPRQSRVPSTDTSKPGQARSAPTATVPLALGGVGVLLLIVLIGPRVITAARLARMRSRSPSAVEAWWRTLLTQLSDHSIVMEPSWTPRQVASQLSEFGPHSFDEISLVCEAIEAERYARVPGSPSALPGGTALPAGSAAPPGTALPAGSAAPGSPRDSDGGVVRGASARIVRDVRRGRPIGRKIIEMVFPRSSARGVWPAMKKRPDANKRPAG